MNKPMLNARISSGYGTRQNPFDKNKTQFHNGIDLVPLTKNENDQKIFFPYPGRIEYIAKTESFGNRIWLKIKDNTSKYNGKYLVLAHMGSFSPALYLSKNVKAGDFAGIVGSTGNSTGVHLHLEIANSPWVDRKPTEPTEIIALYEEKKEENKIETPESDNAENTESVKKDKKEPVKKAKKENGNNAD